MPRILRTVVPRIRRSIAERGWLTSLGRGILLPVHLVRENRATRELSPDGFRSDFDAAHGVHTDGDIEGWTYLSDLEIRSPNWIHGTNYCAIEPERFSAILASLAIDFREFTFIDFGSGKGRALLMASDYPFRRIVGLEFAPELHEAAVKNIKSYPRTHSGCANVESLCVDFMEFTLPPEPSVLFFFDPCSEWLLARVLGKIESSWQRHPRELWLVCVAPGKKKKLLESSSFLVKAGENEQLQFCWYRNR